MQSTAGIVALHGDPVEHDRASIGTVGVIRHGALEVDVDRLSVRVHGQVVAVHGLQLKLLLHLARHPDWVCTREQLLAEIWSTESGHRDSKVVDVLICRLRRRLGVAGHLIETVRSCGYRLRTTETLRETSRDLSLIASALNRLRYRQAQTVG